MTSRTTAAAPATARLVTIDDIERAAGTLRGVVRETPIEPSRTISSIAGMEVLLKCENLQHAGSFKLRGAYNRIANLAAGDRTRGVVAASSGNHAQGVALASRMLGISATVYMPTTAPIPKIEATRGYGATVVLGGDVFDDTRVAAERHADTTGAVFVHAFDHPDVIAGQGTLGLEITAALPAVGTVVVPVGGGGLVSGIAVAVKARNPACKVIGVEATGAASAVASLAAGHPVVLPSVRTICDGIALKAPGQVTFDHLRSVVDEIVTVDDDDTAEALLLLLERAKILAEPSGAIGVAALISGVADARPPVVAVVSGGNIDPHLLNRLIRRGLSTAGRFLNVRTMLDDKPGSLHHLLGVLAEESANVLSVEHHRTGAALPVDKVEVALSLETRDQRHADSVIGRLRAEGLPVYGSTRSAG